MTAYISRVSGDDIEGLISPEILGTISNDGLEIMRRSVMNSDCIWVGTEDGKVLGFWGLIAPTLLSTQAYLWLYTSPALDHHVFVFVRHSQRAVRDMLKLYPLIVGHCLHEADKSHRWLEWLGAKFTGRDGKFDTFEIRAE